MKKIITIVIVIAFAVNSAGQGYLSRTKLNNALRSIATYNFGKGAIRAFEPEATKLGVSYSYVWKPTTLCLEITQRCDNPTPCRICAANATHGAQARLTVQQIKRRLMEAKAAGIKYLSITGGEPTVEEKVLFSAVEEAEKIGIEFVYFNTNCYRWGRSVGFAKKKLRKLAEAKVFSWDKTHATVCISISNEHQKGIPVTRVANFIEAYQATFPGTKLEAIGLRMKEEDKAVASLIAELQSKHLIKGINYREGRVAEIILNNDTLVSFFYNYIIPVNRAADVDPSEYEICSLSDADIEKPISRIISAERGGQALIIGWDNKASPDIVFKCTDTIVIPDSDKKTIAQIITDGNQDPLLRAAVISVSRVVLAARLCGYDKLIQQIKVRHSTRWGFLAELISDPQRKARITDNIIENRLHLIVESTAPKPYAPNGECIDLAISAAA